MEELKLLENELVPVYITSTGEKVVYGTELHAALEVKTKYADWVSRRFYECEGIENEDYETCFSNLGSENHGGQNKKEHIIKLDTAKEMAMLERNEIGKLVRKYFIEVEKKYKEKISSKPDRTEIMLMNARTRQADLYYKLSQVETLSPTYKSILVSKAAETLSGESIIPLLSVGRKTYSAEEIGKKFGISANKVGRIANKHNLKTEEYGEYQRDKSKYSAKEVDVWMYYDTVIPVIAKILDTEVA